MPKKKFNIVSPFESVQDNDFDNDGSNIKSDSSVFMKLQASSKILDQNTDQLVCEVDAIIKKEKDFIDKNITFRVLFNSIKQSLFEYKNSSLLFDSYAIAYDDIGDEENKVKLLDMLREILKERKGTINEVINNLIKIQKLTNDRIRIDASVDDDDVEDLLNPTEM